MEITLLSTESNKKETPEFDDGCVFFVSNENSKKKRNELNADVVY